MENDEQINDILNQIMEREYTMTPDEYTEYNRIMAESIPTNIVVDAIPCDKNENKD